MTKDWRRKAIRKNVLCLVDSKEMITFAPDDESYNGWWPIFGCSLNAIYSRMKN